MTESNAARSGENSCSTVLTTAHQRELSATNRPNAARSDIATHAQATHGALQ